jgi:hypothetical protein
MAYNSEQNGTGRVENAAIGDDFEKKGGYPAGPKPANGVPPVPAGLRTPRTPPPQVQHAT